MIKLVLLDGDRGEIIAAGMMDQGVEQDRLAGQLLGQIAGQAGLARADLHRVVATGYGRDLVSFADTTVTEITCHAVGVHHLIPDAATVIDIGGQDSKLLRLTGDGRVRDFAMNDRCAAGTGRFLEVVADRLGAALSELGELAGRSRSPVAISSMCVVFAETEIVGLLATGTPPADIVAGVQRSIADRVAAMAGRRVTEPVVFTGGVALLPGMVGALEAVLNASIRVPPDPHMTGALGAALLAARDAVA
jgi:predicted CoA-substrate-specific enzyme activase